MQKTFVVAGGSRGIGAELVNMLLQDGHAVVGISRSEAPLLHPSLSWVQHDLTQEGEVPGLPAQIHGLAYCPGSINLKMFRSLKPEEFLADFHINVMGAVRLLQQAQPALKAAAAAAGTPGAASVVLFSTVAVGQGMAFHSSIAAAKGAVEGLTRSLAAEWAPQIRVNAVAPSLTDTPLAARILSGPEKTEASAKRHPLQRVGTTADIAGAARFLLSEQSTWMTGQVLGVDGGMSTLR